MEYTTLQRTKWFDRKFPVIEDNGVLPSILERLEGTEARLTFLVNGLAPETLTTKPGAKWSVKENIGHLADLEPLWRERLDELIQGKPELKPADLTNRKTHEAVHNETDEADLLESFSSQRNALVSRMRSLKPDELNHSALHPRLKTPMHIIDLAYFVAEHDDHHLADIREIISGR